MKKRILLLLAATLHALAAASAVGADKDRHVEIIANIDMTPEGRKVPRPTPENPAYYVPVTLGYNEGGVIIAGEKPPVRSELLRQMAQALAKEGYILQALRPNANETTPSLILAFEWGYLNPVVSEHGALDLQTGEGGTMSPGAIRSDPTQATSTELNQNEMVTLVAGGAMKRQVTFSEGEWSRLREAVAEGRYYLIVSAYDFAASLKGEQVLLWRARMSSPRQGVWMDDVVPALVTGGALIFGRDLDRPQFVLKRIRDARVEIGTETVVEEGAAEPASPTKPSDAPTAPPKKTP
jgi:hypothetical protein